MKKFLEYIIEASKVNLQLLEDIFQKLIDMKYKMKNEKPSSPIIVLAPSDERVQTLKDIADKLNGEYIKDSSASSVGETKINGIRILAKPLTSAKGQSAGEAAEPVVAYMFNALNGNKKLVEESDSITPDILDKLRSKEYSDQWILSSKKSAEKLHSVISNAKEYYACHVNGNDISIVPESLKLLAQIFKSKQLAGMVLKKDKNAFNDLYTGNAKDVWNKADILLVNKKFGIEHINPDQLATGADLNAMLNELILSNTIYPVSLKAISSKADLNQILFVKEGNVGEVEKHETALDKITDVKLVLPMSFNKEKKYVGTCYLKSDTFTIQFRNNSKSGDKDVLSVELVIKNARGGKAAEALRQKLGLVKGFYRDVSFANEKDFIRTVTELFGKIDSEELAKIPKLAEQDSKWFIRTCFKGLVALVRAYRNNILHKTSGQVDLINMFKTFYNAGSGNSSNSIFYLLSMK